MKIIITESQFLDLIQRDIDDEILNESYKLSFEDKKDIEKMVRTEYKNYKTEIIKGNKDIEVAKKVMDFFKDQPESSQFAGSSFDYQSKLNLEKPMLYNEFYKQNFNRIKTNYLKYKERNSPSTFTYISKQTPRLKKLNYKDYYSNLTNTEKNNIVKFINIVGDRVSSGDGESVSRKIVRDQFFKTPKSFQDMFSEKPSIYLWRGDYVHPCDEDYDHGDENYLTMQSFSVMKNVARDFGAHFNASNIESYSGSFSLELFINYSEEHNFDFGDDEGEVMFFDVIYKCKNKK